MRRLVEMLGQTNHRSFDHFVSGVQNHRRCAVETNSQQHFECKWGGELPSKPKAGHILCKDHVAIIYGVWSERFV